MSELYDPTLSEITLHAAPHYPEVSISVENFPPVSVEKFPLRWEG